MGNYSKAIAAFIAAVLGLLVSFGWVEPALADAINEQAAGFFSHVLAIITIVSAVFLSPANKT